MQPNNNQKQNQGQNQGSNQGQNRAPGQEGRNAEEKNKTGGQGEPGAARPDDSGDAE